MGASQSMIRIVDLEKTFVTKSATVHALSGINLDIREGEIFGIIGLSGAGKSTLVRCINYLETPTKGQVIVDGQELGSLNERDLRKARQSIGMIFQQFNLLAQRNVLDNICFPLEIAGIKKKEARKRAKELLDMVGLADKEKAYPAQLSGGQKQRVAIARALATEPKVLLCDEATSALDPTTTKSILELLKEINQKLGITIVIITHEMSVIEAVCNRVAIIDKSKIAEIGDVAEIFASPKSQIGRQLIFTESFKEVPFGQEKMYRIIFDGHSSYEPIISKIVMECKAPINIWFAESKNLNGTAVGQMILQLPEDEIIANKIINYMKTEQIRFEEVVNDGSTGC
jgi:D-methionine transport system ATP-binding protein